MNSALIVALFEVWPCSLETHAERKRCPTLLLVNPVDWPSARLVMYECPKCHSSLAIPYLERGAA